MLLAAFSAEAVLSLRQVLAEVQSWDLPPLVERYRKACRSLAGGELPSLPRVAFLLSGVGSQPVTLVNPPRGLGWPSL